MNQDELIKKYSPVLYFHTDEKHFPSSVDWVLKYSTLVDHMTGLKTKAPTQQDLYNIAKKYNFKLFNDGAITLSIPSETFIGQHPVSDVPCYAITRESGDKLYITYIFFYPYNGNYDIIGLAGLGSHPGDIEHLTLELNKSTGKIIRIFYGAHGSKDGKWVPVRDVSFENGHPVCYVAYNGHGLYNTSGQSFRIGGFANDYLNKGKRWEPKVNRIYMPNDKKFVPNTMGWVAFNGRIGGPIDKKTTEGIMGLMDKSWFVYGDNTLESYYKPPYVIPERFSKGYSVIINILRIAILYVVIVYTKYLLEKVLPQKYNDNMFLKGAIVILVILALYYAYRVQGERLLKKYVPS